MWIKKTKKIDLEKYFFGISGKTLMGNIARKLHAKFHRTSSIKKFPNIKLNVL